jgi:hypothetical protein
MLISFPNIHLPVIVHGYLQTFPELPEIGCTFSFQHGRQLPLRHPLMYTFSFELVSSLYHDNDKCYNYRFFLKLYILHFKHRTI